MSTSENHSKKLDNSICKETDESLSSSLVSRNLTISGHRTSVRLEPDMWTGFHEICRREHLSLHEIGSAVSMQKPNNTSLTAALRVFIMSYFRSATTEEGHSKAGHGPGGAFMTEINNLSSSRCTIKLGQSENFRKIVPLKRKF